MRYIYSVIRFVPDPVRGEFVNVGAIVGSDETSEWTVRQSDDTMRARLLDRRGSLLPAVSEFVDQVECQLADASHPHTTGNGFRANGSAAPSAGWLSDLQLRCTNVVQLSPPLPLVAADLEEAVETVFGQLIA